MAQASTKTAKKATAKKPAAKKAAPKKATPKKAAPKKAPAKTTAAKQAAEEKPKAAPAKPAAKKTAAKSSSASSKKAAANTAKKPAAKAATKKTAAGKETTKKTAPSQKSTSAKKAATKKETSKKETAPKSASTAKKTAPKKVASKKEVATPAAKPAAKSTAKKSTTKATSSKKAAAASEELKPKPKAKTAPKPKASEVAALAEDLAGAARRRRQDASHELGLIAHSHPEALEAVLPELIDALERPEAQTRWEVLLALAELAPRYAGQEEGAFSGAEDSLFDEGSATVRLAAFGFLATYGSTAPERSEAAWPLLDEAIQCYHGDSEYRDMLGYLLTFAKGDIAPSVRGALTERVRFDATSGRGYVQACSAEIIEAAAAKK